MEFLEFLECHRSCLVWLRAAVVIAEPLAVASTTVVVTYLLHRFEIGFDYSFWSVFLKRHVQKLG